MMLRRLPVLCCVLSIALGGVYCEGSSEEQAAVVFGCALKVAEGIAPSPERVRAFCHVARGYARRGEMERAQRYLAQAMTSARDLKDAEDLWAVAAWEFVDAGLYEYAVEAAKLVNPPERRAGLLFNITEVALERGEQSGALTAAHVLLESTKAGRRSVRRDALLIAGRAYGKFGNATAANETFRELLGAMKEGTGGPASASSFAEVFDEFTAACGYEDVGAAVESLYGGSERPAMFMKVGAAFSRHGKRADAEKAFEAAVEAARAAQGLDERTSALAAVARGNAELGRSEAAREVMREVFASFNRLKDQDSRDKTWKSIALTCAALGRFTDALNAARQIESAYDLSDALVKVAHELARDGQFRRALAAIEEAPDAFVVAKGLAALAVIFAEKGRLEEGFRLLGRVKQRPIRTAALVQMARSLNEQADYANAFRAIAQVPSSAAMRDVVAAEIATACTESADEANASENLKVAHKAVSLIGRAEFRWEPEIHVADKYEELGRYKDALGVLRQAQETATRIKDAAESSSAIAKTLGKKVRVYAESGQDALARKALQELSKALEEASPCFHKTVVEESVSELLQGERFALVSELLEGLSDAGTVVVELWRLADCYATRGRTADARETVHHGIELLPEVGNAATRVALLVDTAALLEERRIQMDEVHLQMVQKLADLNTLAWSMVR